MRAPLPTDAPPTAQPELDPQAAQRWRGLARAHSPWLHEEVGQRMAQRLDWLLQTPATWLSWHPALGGWQAQQAVAARWPQARLHLLDEQGRLQPPAASPEPTPASPTPTAAPAPPTIAPGQADLLWANMALHLYAEPQPLLACWHRWLRPDGLLYFSSLGPDTLRELRPIYAKRGWPPPHQPFVDMHDWGDMLVESGFAAPVLDTERIVLCYPSPERLLADLRAFGRNLHPLRPASLRGRGHRQRLLAAIEHELPRTPEGQWSLTFEVIYGHAVRATPRVPVAASSSVPLEQMRQWLRQGRG
ncbi:SAM-dependent methyltransferase [Serpentinimonas maccroryi]|uniref:SAM-dependent methyltransferase n=1 Tax=Serpentinimonas maccroryi TaxID=1458426 RepID=A0A060NT33_9BURK|nr:methyltransferase domain-containing protein [Serpentinimonas maccroryi]BAO82698.1 SAM-dependent methyltransferase [Serpentinimonas maccroryi]